PGLNDWNDELVQFGREALTMRLAALRAPPAPAMQLPIVLPLDQWDPEAARALIQHVLRCVSWAWARIPPDQRTPDLEAVRDRLLVDLASIERTRQASDML